MSNQLSAGQPFPTLQVENIHGSEVRVPEAGTPWVHLQFLRFSGCPICNLHLQPFIGRHEEIRQAGIKEVVVFHSSDERLLPYQGRFPFDVVGDPEKRLYRQYGVGTSPAAILSPAAWLTLLQAGLKKEKDFKPDVIPSSGGPFGLPADFLVNSTGTLTAVHYGKHAGDHWSVDDVLQLAKSVELHE